MAGPIAKPRNVAARTRRRQGSSPLFRAALSVALVVTCVFALPRVLLATRSAVAPGGATEPPALVSGQVVMAGLQPGACMSFAPSDGRANRTVFIDPGHGGLDPGVVGSAGGKQVLEKDAALAVATRLSAMLRADGYRVVMARTADSSVAKLTADDSVTGAMTADAVHRDLVDRAACANASQASVLVSIHFDGFDDPSVGGTETFYDAARPFVGENKRLAQDLQAALVAGLGSNDRGVWTDDQLAAPALTTSGNLYGHLIELGPAANGWVENPSQMPGALVEPLFITNPAEARLASDPAGQQRMALSLETGLQKYFAGA
jgi:N-acetylmuramoyl-L-alanine amidase